MQTDWKLPWNGECRCGQTTLRISAAPLIAMACHCNGCQRMSSSAYSLSMAIPSQGFEVTGGEPVIGGLHGKTQHFFCPHCMTWMFTKPEGMDQFVNVRPTMLANHSWFVPFVETYTSNKLPGAQTGATHSFTEFPDMSDFEGLMADYAARGARPA